MKVRNSLRYLIIPIIFCTIQTIQASPYTIKNLIYNVTDKDYEFYFHHISGYMESTTCQEGEKLCTVPGSGTGSPNPGTILLNIDSEQNGAGSINFTKAGDSSTFCNVSVIFNQKTREISLATHYSVNIMCTASVQPPINDQYQVSIKISYTGNTYP